MKGKEFRRRVKELAAELNMDTAYLNRELGVGFSGGEKKKVEMLQLLLLQPKLAILDETDSGLDVDALSTVSHGMDAYRKSCDGSMLIITHNTRILEHLNVDRVHVMVKGHIVRVEESEEDMYAAIDVAAAKVARQLRKYKTRVLDKKVRATERIVDYAHEDAHPESELDLDRLMDELSEDQKLTVNRARKVQKFLGQPFHVAEVFTGLPGVYVKVEDTVRSFKEILDGKCDHIPEQCFVNKGAIEQVYEAYDAMQKEGN